jgi:hypothetical protein
MTAKHSLDADDKIKIDTWYEVMRVLRHYRDIVYLPEYQLPTGLVLPIDLRNAKERRDRKLATLSHLEKELEAKWAEPVGPYWQSILDPND